jgi:hypothetical protein
LRSEPLPMRRRPVGEQSAKMWLERAVAAADAGEAAAQRPAARERSEFALDEAGHAGAVGRGSRLGEDTLQVLTDDVVKDVPARCAARRRQTARGQSQCRTSTFECQPIRARGAEPPAERATRKVGEAHRFGRYDLSPTSRDLGDDPSSGAEERGLPYSSGLAGSDVSPIR